MAGLDLQFAIGLEPAEAVRYFESKGYQLGFRWQDVAAEAHARAFTVAGVMKVDVLQDVRAALTDALKNGKTFAQFKDGLTPTLQKKGWFGRGDVVDGETGEIQGRRLTPRRLDTIFRTNLQSAYMAGRFKAQMEQVDTRPWWEYVAVLDNRTRPSHAALSGSAYRYDDPFWATFYPPNGHRCRCRVRTRRSREADRGDVSPQSSAGRLSEVQQPVGRDGTTQPAIAYRSPVTGKNVLPDPGFGSNPGQQWARPFTPLPLDTLPRTIPHGTDMPALPSPASPGLTTLLPAGQSPESYARSFLREFGADIGKPVVFNDAVNEPAQINEWLFQDGAGVFQASAARPDAQLVASTIRAPDEIWLYWQQTDGQWALRRRYLKTLQASGGQWGTAVFDQGKDGWSGAAEFPADADTPESRSEHFNRLRGQFLLYRRAP